MKTTTITIVVSLLISTVSFSKPITSFPVQPINVCKAKAGEVFGTFHVHRQGDFASLNWNVTTDGVTSFVIERSYDGEFFNKIAEVSPDAARWNRYTDNTVEPGVIYYRITAYDDGVAVETSSTEMVKIVKHK